MKKWIKEPFLHFIVLGAVIFLIYSLVDPSEDSDRQIVIDDDKLEHLNALSFSTAIFGALAAGTRQTCDTAPNGCPCSLATASTAEDTVDEGLSRRHREIFGSPSDHPRLLR